MSVTFKYALVKINGNPVLVDKKAFSEAKQALKAGVEDVINKVEAITADVKTNGFALETPEGMTPVTLGSASDFTEWVAKELDLGDFNLQAEVGKLPSPASDVAEAVVSTDLVLYSAALFYTGEPDKKLYGELVIGFTVPSSSMPSDFPLTLQEVVIAVDSQVPPAKPVA